jgi:DNA-binding MarR family transcriptional regulator/GNAT superfamily N-acetyltransferase
MPGQAVSKLTVDVVRRFSRFYTRIVGALDQGYLDSPYSLAEVRLLFELSNRDAPTAAVLMRDLDLDAGYLSRLVQKLVRRRLVKRTPSPTDGRESHLSLTASGRAAFAEVEARTRADVAELISPLSAGDQQVLVDAMQRIRSLLGDEPDQPMTQASMVVLRTPNPGDLGWIVQRHGELYAREYGWDSRFEGIVARIMADFVEHFDPQRERAWIAERDGVNAGCIMLVRHPEREGVAKLRVLLVEPSARGLGIGNRLVSECVRFARGAGYHTITLWTYDALASARRIYVAAGFELVAEEKQNSFGRAMTSQTWELVL